MDRTTVDSADCWSYAPDIESLKWPESFNSLKYENYARQRRWSRHRRPQSGDPVQEISVGLLNPGDTSPLPLPALSQSGQYILQLKPSNSDSIEYSWSSVVEKVLSSGKSQGVTEICVSELTETDELLCCTQINASSSSGMLKVWFSASIRATEIAKDIRSDPIQDWTILIKSPLSLTGFLPLSATYSIFEKAAEGDLLPCSRGLLIPGRSVNVYNADIRKPLLFSLTPQRGWLPLNV